MLGLIPQSHTVITTNTEPTFCLWDFLPLESLCFVLVPRSSEHDDFHGVKFSTKVELNDTAFMYWQPIFNAQLEFKMKQ